MSRSLQQIQRLILPFFDAGRQSIIDARRYVFTVMVQVGRYRIGAGVNVKTEAERGVWIFRQPETRL